MNPSNFQILMNALPPRLGQQGAQDTTDDLLLQVMQEQHSARQDNQNFQQQQRVFNQRLLQWTDQHEELNKRQEKPNKHQDQSNTIFLDETRGVKMGIRKLADMALKQYESRLKRLEDLTGGFLRKAG